MSVDLLTKHGFKKTPARLEVLEILQKASYPLLVQEIQGELVKRKLEVNEVTIYRILDAFCEKGILLRVVSNLPRGARYELNSSDHHHFTCESCGRIEEVGGCTIENFIKPVAIKNNWTIKHHLLEFSGLCTSCH
jgi:Fe2+ or Zn2+ uptake regulation protein